MYPREQRVEIHGSYTLVNKGTEAIEVLPISIGHRWDPNGYLPFGGQVILDSIQLPGHRVRLADEELGFWLLELVELTLEKMAHGGIYDHLGGGFRMHSSRSSSVFPKSRF